MQKYNLNQTAPSTYTKLVTAGHITSNSYLSLSFATDKKIADRLKSEIGYKQRYNKRTGKYVYFDVSGHKWDDCGPQLNPLFRAAADQWRSRVITSLTTETDNLSVLLVKSSNAAEILDLKSAREEADIIIAELEKTRRWQDILKAVEWEVIDGDEPKQNLVNFNGRLYYFDHHNTSEPVKSIGLAEDSYVTRCIPYDYNPNADTTTILNRMSQFFETEQQAKVYLQRLALAMERKTKQILLIQGPTNSGKTTITQNLISIIMKGYSNKLPVGSLLVTDAKNISGEMSATLSSALYSSSGNMVIGCEESTQGGHVNDLSLLTISSMGEISLKKFHTDPTPVMATATLIWAYNHHPKIDNYDDAIAERIYPFSLPHKTDKNRQNANLVDDILQHAEELIALLCKMFVDYSRGIDYSADKSYDDYRRAELTKFAENRILHEYLDDRGLVVSDAQTTIANGRKLTDFRRDFMVWCASQKIRYNPMQLETDLKILGAVIKKSGNSKYIINISKRP